MKRKIGYLMVLIIFILSITIPISTATQKQTGLNTTWAKVRLSVLDEQNQPIDMATICVIETKEYYSTQKLGQCEIEFYLNKSDNIFNFPSWQEFTILIYKNGFKPHILYGLKATPNITRTGIVITLKDINFETTITHTKSYDYPSDSHSQNIINNYKK